MDGEEAAYVEAIRAHPADDAPRLAYSAWLEGRQDVRGELLRVQWELAQLSREPSRSGRRRHDKLRAREDEIVPKLLFPSYRRGSTGWWLVADGEQLTSRIDDWRRVLVRDLLVNGRLGARAFDTLLDVLQLARLRAFGWTWPLELPQLHELAASGHWEGVSTIDLGRAGLGDDGVAAVAGADGLDRLETLGLSGNGIGAGARALAVSAHFRGLRALDLSGNELTAEAIRAIVASASLGALRELDLSGNELGPAAIAALCDTPGLERLRALGLGACRLDAGAAQSLAGCRRLAGLERLRLAFNHLGPSALRCLVDSPHLSRSLALELDPQQLGLRRVESYDGPIAVAEWWDGPPRGELRERFRLACVPPENGPHLGQDVAHAADQFLGSCLAPRY